MKDIYYLDNAATSWPKPEIVYEQMDCFFRQNGVNPDRGTCDKAVTAEELVRETRDLLCQFFNAKNLFRMIFTMNITDSLNLAFNGLFKEGEHVISTNLEHNAALRPIRHSAKNVGITYDFIEANTDGYIEIESLKKALKPESKYLVVNHGSNVIGTVQDFEAMGNFAREHELVFIVDTAQTAGVIPIDVEKMNIDILTFTGHKGLYGPMGVGGMWVREGIEVKHTRTGGTGIDSAVKYHLENYPHRLEAGTPNLPGIIGLNAGQKFFAELGRQDNPDLNHKQATDKALISIHTKEMELFKKMGEGIKDIPKIRVIGPSTYENRVATLCFVLEGMETAYVGVILTEDFNIATRTGVHCAPLIHQQWGTLPAGATRLSLGYYNDEEDVEHVIKSVAEIATGD